MEKKCLRKDLVKSYDDPKDIIKFELWPNGQILIFGLFEDKTDYIYFDSWHTATKFLEDNYKMP